MENISQKPISIHPPQVDLPIYPANSQRGNWWRPCAPSGLLYSWACQSQRQAADMWSHPQSPSPTHPVHSQTVPHCCGADDGCPDCGYHPCHARCHCHSRCYCSCGLAPARLCRHHLQLQWRATSRCLWRRWQLQRVRENKKWVKNRAKNCVKIE